MIVHRTPNEALRRLKEVDYNINERAGLAFAINIGAIDAPKSLFAYWRSEQAHQEWHPGTAYLVDLG